MGKMEKINLKIRRDLESKIAVLEKLAFYLEEKHGIRLAPADSAVDAAIQLLEKYNSEKE